MGSEERLREEGLFSQRRDGQENPVTVYKYLIGGSKEDGDKLLVVPGGNKISNEHKLIFFFKSI